MCLTIRHNITLLCFGMLVMLRHPDLVSLLDLDLDRTWSTCTDMVSVHGCVLDGPILEPILVIIGQYIRKLSPVVFKLAE